MKYLISHPDIMGGSLVIKQTRTPIEVILYRIKEGYSISEIQKHYPWIDKKTLAGAIDEIINLVNMSSHAEKIL